jgi:DNA phosphorothioation-associated putative methyltransferase
MNPQPRFGAQANLEWNSRRQRTAIGRRDISMPARQALRDELIVAGLTVLDYGSGRGQDVDRLRRLGISVTGWDPYYSPGQPPECNDVVLLTYVLNVIEDPEERCQVLRDAWSRAGRVLVVSSRLSWDSGRLRGEIAGDGVISSIGTFQHLFTPSELRSLVNKVTQSQAVQATPGVVYAFKKTSDRLAYLARRTLGIFEWSAAADYGSALASVVHFVETVGRMPSFEELPAEHLATLSRHSMNELSRVVLRAASQERMQEGAKRSTLDALLYLAMDLFNGRAAFSDLPLKIQVDIRRFIGSYRTASQRADRLLLKLRDDQYLRGAMRNSVGKLTPTALYIHVRALDRAPIILRLYEHCGAVAAGRVPQATLVKLHHDRRAVAWLGYPDFESDPHPRTAWSYQVKFPDFETSFTDFSGRANRPLLHRKEEFLSPDDPLAAKFSRLTQAEVRAGLYRNPHLIGTEDGWAAELERCGVLLKGHRLVRA